MKYENREQVQEILSQIANLEIKLFELSSDNLTVGIYTSVNVDENNCVYKIYRHAFGFPFNEIHDSVEKIRNTIRTSINNLKSDLEKL